MCYTYGMTLDNYKIFSLEIGLKFKTKPTDADINKLFKKLIDIHEFNGVKTINNDDEEEEVTAKLTSSDDTLRLFILETDISLSFTDKKLVSNSEKQYGLMNKVFKEVLTRVDSYEFDAMRANIVAYSTNIKDKAHMISELFNEKYQADIDDFDIWVENKAKSLDGKDLVVATSISNDHSNSMHEAFEAKSKENLLDKLTVVHTASGLLEEVDTASIESFSKYAMSGKLNELSLTKLGYGQK